ncbi:diacylglycerol kinase [Niastella caeni]|uniref:Diacylglycerol kinase n=1 Tax=Niastella caeni TaxID=2569763 RepID=A0A4S8HVH2_9BACT|nr:diacylglycerol kinase family protein [Niastella caeni]THU39627.1 diacylglycerol kinase [Niastella caeni]
MKRIHLIHNPGAGDEAHSKSTLLKLIEAAGYECRYCSTDNEEWQQIDPQSDFIVIAGGDGTVKEVVSILLQKEDTIKRTPVAILPCGTANNIAESLNIKGELFDIIRSWSVPQTTAIDVGEIFIDGEEPRFFIESFGYGLFPYLMKEMDKQNKNDIEDKDLKMRSALQLMHAISHSYEPHYCELTVDGEDHSGAFLMAEVMNTRLIGPNLFLSPHGHPGDGTFEVVLIPGEDQAKFAAYIDCKLKEEEVVFTFITIKAEDIKIKWKGTHVHIDDEQVTLKENALVHVRIQKNALVFLI